MSFSSYDDETFLANVLNKVLHEGPNHYSTIAYTEKKISKQTKARKGMTLHRVAKIQAFKLIKHDSVISYSDIFTNKRKLMAHFNCQMICGHF